MHLHVEHVWTTSSRRAVASQNGFVSDPRSSRGRVMVGSSTDCVMDPPPPVDIYSAMRRSVPANSCCQVSVFPLITEWSSNARRLRTPHDGVHQHGAAPR